MLTRLVRIQLGLFAVASVVGMAVMIGVYLQAPTLLGIGRMTVTLELPATGGLYQFSNVSYRGVQVGKVTEVRPTREGAVAILSLNSSEQIPADLHAAVLSVSAVGEQYVDLQPSNESGPYLHDGSVIPVKNTSIPQAVGPMLDQVSSLIGSVPKDKISPLLDETFKGFNGSGYDFGSLLDSSSQLIGEVNAVADQSRSLIDDSGPLLDGQAQSIDAIRTWARSLSGVTEQLATNDPQVRTLLQQAPGAADEASRLFNQLKPTLPLLLANLTSLGQIGVTYHPSLEQLLVLLPPVVFDPILRSSEEQPHRHDHGRLHPDDERSAGLHRRLPSAEHVAIPRGHDGHRYARRLVLQAAAGFSDRRSRRPQLPLHGQPRQARSDGPDLQQRQAFRAAGDASARPRSLPDRPEPHRPGNPT